MSRTQTPALALMVSTAWPPAQDQRKEAAQVNTHKSIHAVGQFQMRKHAEAEMTVQSSEAKPYDQTESPTLTEIRLIETFSRDIDGESPIRALQVLHHDHSASLISVQRFSGKLGGRQGTFVLQGHEMVEHGRIKATWFGGSRIGGRRSFRAARRGRL